MSLTKYKLGELIIRFSKVCGIPDLNEYQISGVNRDKEFFEPSHQVGGDTSKYQIVPQKHFACNLMHVGRDVVLPIAYNHSDKEKIVSPAYSVFRLAENCGVLDDYFFIMLKSYEKDRYFWFQTDSSIRDGMTWDDFCNVEITVPDLPTQQKYVDIYQAMVANQQVYERGLDDLKLVCDGYIEELRRNMPCEEFGKYCYLSDERNIGEKNKNVKGLTVYKQFIDTKADMSGVALGNYKVVCPGDIAYVSTTNRNGDRIACGLAEETCIISSIYDVIKIKDVNTLLPEYLFMWFRRAEMDRYSRYNSWGSAREMITWEDLSNYKIPVPSFDVQTAIVNIYKSFNARSNINEKLKAQIRDICPILIKGSLEDAKKEA